MKDKLQIRRDRAALRRTAKAAAASEGLYGAAAASRAKAIYGRLLATTKALRLTVYALA